MKGVLQLAIITAAFWLTVLVIVAWGWSLGLIAGFALGGLALFGYHLVEGKAR